MWIGVGLVTGLHGHGDGPDFGPLVHTLAALEKNGGGHVDPADAALVTMTANVATAGDTIKVDVCSVGPSDDLRDGYLIESALLPPDPHAPRQSRVWGPLTIPDPQTPARGAVTSPFRLEPR